MIMHLSQLCLKPLQAFDQIRKFLILKDRQQRSCSIPQPFDRDTQLMQGVNVCLISKGIDNGAATVCKLWQTFTPCMSYASPSNG